MKRRVRALEAAGALAAGAAGAVLAGALASGTGVSFRLLEADELRVDCQAVLNSELVFTDSRARD